MKLSYYLTPATNINSRWIKDLNVRPETIKLLEENIGSKLLDISLDYDFFGSDSKSKCSKTKIIMWDYIKVNSFCTAKETMNKMKRQTTEWEKIFANHITDEVNTSNI